MPQRFHCIGFPVESAQQLSTLAETAAQAGSPHPCIECTYIEASFPDGGRLWVQVNKQNEIVGCVPHFEGESVMRVRVGGVRRGIETPFDGSMLLWVQPDRAAEGNLGIFPIMVDVPDFCATALHAPIGATVDVRIAAFADDLQCVADLSEIRDVGGPFGEFAPKTLIPTGLMKHEAESSQVPEALAVLSGVIVSGEMLGNPVTHEEFLHLVVETLGGTMDIVAQPGRVKGEPVVGGIAVGEFWLSGRIVRCVD